MQLSLDFRIICLLICGPSYMHRVSDLIFIWKFYDKRHGQTDARGLLCALCISVDVRWMHKREVASPQVPFPEIPNGFI
jgi:hypothetical protein